MTETRTVIVRNVLEQPPLTQNIGYVTVPNPQVPSKRRKNWRRAIRGRQQAIDVISKEVQREPQDSRRYKHLERQLGKLIRRNKRDQLRGSVPASGSPLPEGDWAGTHSPLWP